MPKLIHFITAPFKSSKLRSLRYSIIGLLCIGITATGACAAKVATAEKPTVATEVKSSATPEERPIVRHGQLAVAGNRIVDHNQKPVSLAGPSLFWGNKGWGGDKFYTAAAVRYAKNEWKADIIRVAMGADARGGLLYDWDGRMQKVRNVVDAALAEGLYVIIDWHSHHAENNLEAAQRFFRQMATDYGKHPNIIYEIYNEPLPETDWSKTIKPYAEAVIATIRSVDPDNIIVVGTQSWSQDVDKAADDRIAGPHIAYALHFYAGTHAQELRDKALYALRKGVALFVTEWGAVNADGDGAVAREETQRWMDFIRQHHLSHCNWAFNSKDEGASTFKPHTNPTGPWSDQDLTEAGLLAKDIIQNW